MWYLIHHFVSPKKFFNLSNKLLPWLVIFFLISFGYGLISGLFLTPADYLQGEGFRIIYVHAPAAFLSLLIYGMMTAAAIFYLIFHIKLGFLVIKHSLSIGACFTLLALLTGSLWGKPMWGTWWIWDARLTSELILFFLYVSLLLFHSAIAHKKSGTQITAILVLIGSVDLPIIHYSVYWWNTLHQGATLKILSPSTIDASMRLPLFAMILAFMAYYAIILILRIRYSLTCEENNHHWLRNKARAFQ